MTTNKIKLALTLNAFVLPGLGYFFIGKKIKGALIVIATLVVFAAGIVEFGAAFARAVQFSPHLSNNVALIIDALAMAWTLTKIRILIYIGILLLLWLYGILDVMLIRKKHGMSPR